MGDATWAYGDDEDHGGAAEHNGQPLTACPFKPGTEQHADWAQAWTRARSDRLKASGQMQADTAAAKALANADFQAAGYARPDPVAALLGPDRPVPMIRLSAEMGRDAAAIYAAMETVAQRMAEVMRRHLSAFTEAAEQISKLNALVQADPPPSPFTEHLTAVVRLPTAPTIKDTSS